jgi:hypothetical protein
MPDISGNHDATDNELLRQLAHDLSYIRWVVTIWLVLTLIGIGVTYSVATSP